MPAIRTIDMRLIDDLFGMGGGYVLNLGDKTFGAFFREEVAVNIDEPRYSEEGTSKAKRLRYFLKISDQKTAPKVLEALWEYRETDRRRQGAKETYLHAEAEFAGLIERLGGNRPKLAVPTANAHPEPKIEPHVAHELRNKLPSVRRLDPQARLRLRGVPSRVVWCKRACTARFVSADGRASRWQFRTVRRHVLLEAKWEGSPIGVAGLHVFHGTLDEKAAWTRGLFVSNNGFSDDRLIAFGRAKATRMHGRT